MYLMNMLFKISICTLLIYSVVIKNVLAKPPNIIVVIADDLGWNDVGYHGSSQIKTPNIDALAYNGIILSKFYAQHSCTPSRSAFLTGQYPIRTGYQGYPVSPGENRSISHTFKTLPKELYKLGYRTHMIGKWHLGHSYKHSIPTAYGYESHFGYYNGYIGYYDHSIQMLDTYFGKDLQDNNKGIDVVGHITDIFTNRAIETIKQHNPDEPLFLTINHLAAHTGKTVKDGETVLEVENITATNIKYDYIVGESRRMYAEIVENLDESIGKVISALKQKEILDNSIILFLSDNGAPSFGWHNNTGSNFPFRSIKLTNFEGGVRVPAILYAPQLPNLGRIYDKLFHITDLVPTLYHAAGGNTDEFSEIDGIDHWNNLKKRYKILQNYPRKEVLINYDEVRQEYAYIDANGRYKIIKNSDSLDRYAGDPGNRRGYDISAVLNSPTNRALNPQNNFMTYIKSILNIKKLRAKATIRNCRKGTNFAPKPCTNICLFDLVLDPCETTDLSEIYPNIVERLFSKMEEYERFLVPQQNTDIDPNADPAKCHGFWYTWLDGCENQTFSK